MTGDPLGGVHPPGGRRRLPAWLAASIVVWLPLAAATVITVGAAYAVGQQVLRGGANDPQTQVAVDDAARLAAGTSPAQVADGPGVDLASSLATVTIVYSGNGAVLASTATLDGAVPRPPLGALKAAAPGRPNTITWQPRPGVRQAAVIAAYTGPGSTTIHGFVLVSRSLRLVEQREDDLLGLAALAALAGLAVTGAVTVAATAWWDRR